MEGIDLHWLQDDRMTHFRTNKTLLCLTLVWKDDGLNKMADKNNSILWSEVWNLLHTDHNELSDARCHITKKRMLHSWHICVRLSTVKDATCWILHTQSTLPKSNSDESMVHTKSLLFVFYPQSKVHNFRSRSYFISPKEFDLDKVDCI